MKTTKTTKTALELLQEKSNNAVSVIRSTIENLKLANDEIVTEVSKNNDQIVSLNETNASLDQLMSSNNKVISKFEALLGYSIY